jgi:hypothetical protein
VFGTEVYLMTDSPAHVPKSKWNANLPHLGSMSISPLICLDAFHAPDLPSDASILVLPASSPSSGAAELLLAQAQTLSVTHSSVTLMCDGAGPDSLSALVDPWGRVLYQQTGGGSFVVHAAVDWDGSATIQRRTGWELFGASGVLGLVLAFIASGSLIAFVTERGPQGMGSAISSGLRLVQQRFVSVAQAARNRFARTQQQPLIDAD